MVVSHISLLLVSVALVSALTLEYGIVMDAGSSGTRAYVYQWHSDHRPQLFVFPEISPLNATVNNQKVSPGISTFFGNTLGLNQSLGGLITFAKNNIPAPLWNETLIIFTATAGMRLLPDNQRASIMSDVRSLLNTSGFLYKPEYCNVISGEDEGSFGWVAVNYLKRTLNNLKEGSFGALDLGGASTQISFPVSSDYKGPNTTKVSFGDTVNFPLYTISYLGLGVDQVYLSIQKMLISRNNGDTNVSNPCNPIGWTEIITVDGTKYNFTGSADYQGCREVTATFLKNFIGGPIGREKPTIPTTLNFIGVSAFLYTFAFYNISGNTNNPSLSHLYNLTASVCPYNVDQVVTMAKATKSSTSFANKYCFYGVFVTELLVTGYGFDNYTTQINAIGSIEGTEVSYAPGAMVYYANDYYNRQQVISSTTSSPLSTTTSIGGNVSASLSFVSVMVALCLVLIAAA